MRIGPITTRFRMESCSWKKQKAVDWWFQRVSEFTYFEEFATRSLDDNVTYQRRNLESEILPIGLECSGMSNVGSGFSALSAKKNPKDKRQGFFQSPIIKVPNHTVYIDYSGPSTKSSSGFKYILVMVDLFTPCVECVPFHLCHLVFVYATKPERLGLPDSSLSHGKSNSCSWCHRVLSVFLMFRRRPRIPFEILFMASGARSFSNLGFADSLSTEQVPLCAQSNRVSSER